MKQLSELERIDRAKQSWEDRKKAGKGKKGFNAMSKKFKSDYKHKQTKAKKEERQPVELLTCSCGNTIRMFNKQEEVKCFRCNFWWRKDNGKWAKDRDGNVMTMGDLLISLKKRGTK